MNTDSQNAEQPVRINPKKRAKHFERDKKEVKRLKLDKQIDELCKSLIGNCINIFINK